MRLEKIVLKNFLTYKELEYDFKRAPLLVQGKNLTEEDQESNGSGKSGIFTGIEFCIAGSNSRDVRDKELVMFGEKEAVAELYASCDVRKEHIHIEWNIKIKGSNKLKISVQKGEGEFKEVSFSNVNDGKKFILDWFDIEKEDLFNYYIINKSRFKTFFKASNKEKVELINRFSDASIVDGLDKLDNTELEAEYNIIKSNINKIDGKIELTNEQIQWESNLDKGAEAERLKFEYKGTKENLEEDRSYVLHEKVEIDELIKEDQKEIKSLRGQTSLIENKIRNAKKLVDGFSETDFQSHIDSENDVIYDKEDLISKEETELEDLDDKDLRLDKLIKELNVELSGAVECPSCSHEFTIDSKHGTLQEVKNKASKAVALKDKVKRKAESHQAIIDKVNKDIDAISLRISKLKEDRDSESKIKRELFENLNTASSELNTINGKIIEFETSINEHKADLGSCDVDINKINAQLSDLKAEYNSKLTSGGEDKVKVLKETLDTLKADKLISEGELSEKGDEIYKRNQWANNFKQFRMHLANQSLEAIEFHMNRYLVGMESDLKVKLEGFKILANGTFKEEITAKIVRDVERTFSSFSGGEQGRLLFAAILANRHMINSTHKYGGLDFLSIDEVFEGVDSLGLKKLVKSAKQLEIAVMIITHVTDEEVNDDILLIEKINGMSYVKTKE